MDRESRRRLQTRRAPASVSHDLGLSRPAHCKERFWFSLGFLPRAAPEGACFRKVLAPNLERHTRPADTAAAFALVLANCLASLLEQRAHRQRTRTRR